MIRISARFWGRVYTGAVPTGRGVRAEWPPSPYRLAAALLAGAHQCERQTRELARQALYRLVAAPHPVIHVPQARAFALPSTYAPPTGFSEPKGRFIDQFTALRPRMTKATGRVFEARMVLAGTDIAFDVDLELEDAELRALDGAASRVGYLGRATHPAELSVDRIEAETVGPAETRVMLPVADGEHQVRGWTAESIEDLDVLHEAYLAYVPSIPPGLRGCRVSYAQMQGPVRVEGLEIVPLTKALADRGQVAGLLRRIHAGLGGTGMEDVTVFPLVQVGHSRSTGACSGIGFHHRSDLGMSAAAAWFTEQHVLGERSGRFTPLQALMPGRWARPSRRWVSATPVPLHPDARVARLVAADLFEQATGVAPESVHASEHPVAPGSDAWGGVVSDGLRPWYMDTVCTEEVAGPIILSVSTDDPGFGVLIPVPEEAP